jgi:hypothetical protein
MRYRTIFIYLFLLTLIGLVTAAATEINYQGRLTDETGQPVADDYYQLTFTIYNFASAPLWTSGMQTVQVTGGLFNYILGSSNPIPDSLFNESELYLGIQVGSDPEITPKTKLTSAAYAAVANKVVGGGVETGDGLLKVTDEDEEISIGALSRGKVGINIKSTEPLDKNLLTFAGDPDGENRLDLFYPGAEASEGIVQMSANPTVGGFLSIHAAEPLLAEGFRAGVAAPDTGFVRLFGGGHGSEYPLIEMTAQSEEGGKLNIYNEIGKVMGFEPSPFSTCNLEFYNPSGSMPNDPYIRMGTQPSPFYAGRLEFFDASGTMPNDPYIRMGIQPSPFNTGGVLELLDPSHGTQIEIMGNSIDGASVKMFQPQPEPPGREAMAMGVNPGSGFSIKMFQPQPEPPGHVAIEMAMNTAEKGSGGGRLNVFDRDSIQTSITGGSVVLSDPNDINVPVCGTVIDSSESRFSMRGAQPPMGGDPAVISMVARTDSAKVGIGTDTPSEALAVVGNIVATGSINEYTSTKMKRNIENIDNAIEIVSTLNGVRYDWRRDEYPEMKLSNERQIGLLAEDVDKVLPELVREDAEGNKMVAYTKLTAVLIEALKEQQEIINDLQKRLEALERY